MSQVRKEGGGDELGEKRERGKGKKRGVRDKQSKEWRNEEENPYQGVK